ncbi:MAG TPA: GlsB/YeaQ/YmgE family stress response membrane protein [Thermoleophilaceae bacterium]|jgi:uncharacterized membrane protein YeaQ/YmgE (transglycosylase-associated protein family)|nr:GlsB/YeaQ/YmgE family stress response membrane protein [Thermoleophilaceae bacterium]
MVGAVILGIVAGYLGRFLMPGRDKMGFLATTALGLAGALLGWVVFTALLGIGDQDAFDLGGLVGAVVGVLVLLALLRAYRDHESHQHRYET